jgi:hypothetical protein
MELKRMAEGYVYNVKLSLGAEAIEVVVSEWNYAENIFQTEKKWMQIY